VKHQQANIFKITSLFLILLFFGLMSASVTHAETYHFVTKWGSEGSGDGQFTSPSGVVVGSSDNVYVADTSNHCIQEFDSSGSFLTKWGSSGSSSGGPFTYPEGVAVDSSGNVYVADTNNHRIVKFDSNGKFLTKWGSSGSDEGQFEYPRGVAVDSSGNVYVADTENNRIQKFDKNGTFLTKFGSEGTAFGEFYSPCGVAVDSSGNVYVADKDNNRIQKFDSSGEFSASFGSSGNGNKQFYSPSGVAVDSSGNVYVADSGNGRIQEFDGSGKFLTKWGSEGSGDGQLSIPSGVAVDSSGNVYVADTENNRIQKFDGSGKFLKQWGSYGSGDGQFNVPKCVAIDSSGNVYVADASNHRIQKFDESGTFLTKWNSYGNDGDFYNPSGVAVDSSGNVYVADSGNNRIQKFNSNGKFLTKWGSYGDGDGQFINPESVAVDSSGNVYVVDTENNRIQKFDSGGTFLTEWGSEGYGHGQFYNPVSVAVDSSGRVYVVDSGNNRIQKFNSIGKYLTEWYYWDSDDGYFNPSGVAVDSSGNVYVADSGNNRILKFDSNGKYLTQWGSYGSNSGQFKNPSGVAVDSSGNVYVADKGNHCIQKFVVKDDSFPVASFSSNVTSGPVPLTVKFTDFSKKATSWNWNFGDGVNSTEQNPVHTFLAAGSYTVNLTVGNEKGTDSNLATINVDSPSYYSVNGHYYYAVSVPDGITWTDAKTAAESFTYLGMSGHLATITSQGENEFIYNNLGVTPSYYLLGAFQPDGSQEPDGGWQWVTGESWNYTNWNSGEPNNAGDEDALQFYGSDIWNDCSHEETDNGYVVEYEPTHPTPILPVANFSTNVSKGYAPLSVQFTDLSENATEWKWSFGDGKTSTLKNPAHTYSKAGKYTVSLTVKNAAGSNTKTITNYITVKTAPVKPVAAFSAKPISGNAPLKVQFTDKSTNSPTSWSWIFGDGSTSTSKSPAHTYSKAGKYNVKLTVKNAAGSSTKTITNYITVKTVPVKPVAAFSAKPISGNAPLKVQFTDKSTNSPTSWSWTFGDGSTSTSKNPAHTYTKAGKYTVKLTVKNAAGSSTKTIANYITVKTVPVKPVAAFSAKPISGNAPLKVQFTDKSTNSPTSWSWTFGDGSTSTSKNPAHTYTKAGKYTVKLTVKNAAGSSTKTIANYITVKTAPVKPVAAFSAKPISGKVPLKVQFTDKSSNVPTSWKWTFGDGSISTLKNPPHTYTKAGKYTVSLTVKNTRGSNTKTMSGYITVSKK